MAVALILAAGAGQRLGARRPKALVELGGRAMLEWSVEMLSSVQAMERIVVALPGEAPGIPGEGAGAGPEVVAVAGGRTRSQSVRLALAAAPHGDPVLVHDAARPLATAELALDVLAELERADADGAIAAAPVTDTIKEVNDARVVRRTLERASLWSVQTPQAFRREALERALGAPEEALARATDDAWLVERAGGKVVVVPAPRENIKVTTALDLVVAETLLERAGSGKPA